MADDSLTKIDEIVERILAQRKDLTKGEILALIENKKREMCGFLSDEGAARLIAQDLRVEIGGQVERMRIKDLLAGLDDVTTTGRVAALWPMKEFRKSDGSVGKVTRFLLADGTGEINCIAWDEKAEELSTAELRGKILRVMHGYTREGLAGEVELHCGERSELVISPEDADEKDYPRYEEFFTSIGEITYEKGEVNTVGIVKVPPRFLTFKKEGVEGSVLRTKIIDKTGKIAVVAWNNRADELKQLERGQTLQIVNARVKRGMNGLPELHINGRSQVAVLSEKPKHLEKPVLKLVKISEFKPGMKDVDVLVHVLKVGQIREVKKATGGSLYVERLLVGDDSGIIEASLWSKNIDLLKETKEGDILLIEEASVRERLGEISLSVGEESFIQANPQIHEAKALAYPRITRIRELTESRTPIIVEGTVVDTPTFREVKMAGGEKIGVTSVRISDGSGEVKISFWRQLAKTASTLMKGDKIRVTGLYVKPGLTEKLELSSRALTTLNVLSKFEGNSTSEPPRRSVN
jgi:replication factor A1